VLKRYGARASFAKVAEMQARTSQRRVAWLALDRGDADAGLFLTHLVAAIQTAEPEAGIDALALLEAGGSTVKGGDVAASVDLPPLHYSVIVLGQPSDWRGDVAVEDSDAGGVGS
jgi:hypothetical protein